MSDDSGWKQVHGDVFRRPPHMVWFSSLVGTGTQLLLATGLVILAALAGSLYVDRGAVTRAAVMLYALTSAVSGFISGRFYRAHFLPDEAPQWITVMLATACLFPGAVFGCILLLNAIATMYATTNALSILTVVKIVRWQGSGCVVVVLVEGRVE